MRVAFLATPVAVALSRARWRRGAGPHLGGRDPGPSSLAASTAAGGWPAFSWPVRLSKLVASGYSMHPV